VRLLTGSKPKIQENKPIAGNVLLCGLVPEMALWRLGMRSTVTVLWMALLSSGAAYAEEGELVRTVVFVHKPTAYGQNVLIKGGHDASLVPDIYPLATENIFYNNTRNAWSSRIKVKDRTLDWEAFSAMDWTTNAWPDEWGPKQNYKENGTGEDPENQWDHHYWKFDVMMEGQVGDWFEFRAVMRDDYGDEEESAISQPDAPYRTQNHWGKKGFVTVIEFNGDEAQYISLY
jgi:alpha-amylase